MNVTRIAYSQRLNPGKYAALAEQARRLGRVRSLVWQRYGCINGVGSGLRDRQVRDRWMSDGTAEQFGVLANAWKETVRDAMADIAANMASTKVKVRQVIGRRSADPAERKRLFTALKADQWTGDPYLRRQMRRHWKRGKNRTHNQIVVRCDQYQAAARGNHAKAGRIRRHNLGTVKRDRQAVRHRAQVRTEIFTAVHAVVDKAAVIVAEDLTKTFTGRKKLGKDMNRRLAGWTKGVTAQALQSVSERRGSALRLVNAAYTSQVAFCCAALGHRNGDSLHCIVCGVVWQADHAAAINILQRAGDPDITLHTPHWRVKQILQERAVANGPDCRGPGLQPG